MTRHGKNCTAGAVYTYHEKKKDTASSGYGTQSVRLGKDAIKDFDCCSLSLQPCRDPVVTPDGFLFEREAILEYVLHQKLEISRKMKAYEKQKKEQNAEQKVLQQAAEESKVKNFLKKESSIISKPLNPFSGEQSKSISSSSEAELEQKDSKLPSFWIPSLTPEAKQSALKKPDKTVYCPMSGKPIKVSDLIPVKFSLINSSLDRVSLITKQERYVCAVTKDVLGNSVPCAVLRPSGAVVTLECVEKLIRKDMVDPITGDRLSEKDIIILQRGGTGFSGSGIDLKATQSRPVMQV
ncbi:nitric oxide synthase-interacting protein [Erpetoichthys calabaricus]|uniref:Nitric oxide synthase-interacting protein n=1 Tax=Erpetoichthys calabaricus TaxID=27687 RepID=A0A8C4X8H8_ERPCA|nr:nitric oxide synthase-interacting protein [Erpetoichthys calabaricus]